MKRPQTPFAQAVGLILGLILVVFVVGLCINYSIQNNDSRNAREQYSNDTGCTWAGNEVTGYHMEC